jgi:hypothetical protein
MACLLAAKHHGEHNSEHHRINLPSWKLLMFWFYRGSVKGELQIGEFLVNGWREPAIARASKQQRRLGLGLTSDAQHLHGDVIGTAALPGKIYQRCAALRRRVAAHRGF